MNANAKELPAHRGGCDTHQTTGHCGCPDWRPHAAPRQTTAVPDDLVAWFRGDGILAERHNLPRIQGRFRVVQVRTIIGDEDEPYVIKGEWREFKTEAAASRLQKKWAAEGHAVLLQAGFTFWPDPEEMPGGTR